ncbi:NACHT domain-containing protein [Bacillus tropicus]|uniref:NACHT domain-containing protein n=1 Tax=Bacillus tropicus TaxID=2026188 RepID=A0A7T2QEB6_9BACI|nr:ATP-binding protein [Bacillus tropicus]AJG93798.1 archaeal ATPase family protein [Bacillus cereus]PFU96900.1 NACHT domain-containing protein [Bacillus anthracis]QPR77155.1 NACHT domain-containing protein [Bacillus tropicus]
MSGVDNLRGIDYQISYSVLRLLQMLVNEYDEVDSIQFESLTEDEEDLNIFKKNGNREYIQIKKKAEGYSWTASELRGILQKFYNKNDSNIKFTFISDGTGNRDVAELKSCLLNDKKTTNELLKKFSSTTLTVDKIKSILDKTTLLTQSYTSVDSSFPGSVIRENCLNLLRTTNFTLSNSPENIFESAWAYILKLSQECKIIKLDNIKTELESKGLKITKKTWLNIPDISSFSGREEEIYDIEKQLDNIRKIVVKGISGIGKTSIMAKIAHKLHNKKKKVFWLEANKMYTISDILREVTNFLHNYGLEYEAQLINSSELVQRIPRLTEILKNEEVYLFIDSLDKATMEVKSFFEELYKDLINYKLKGAIAISSIDGLDSYTSVDLKRNKVFEYHLLGLSYIDTLEIFRNINKNYHEEDFRFFYKLVGGYPVSINLLRELLSEDSITIEELTELQELTLESSNKHLFQKVFTTLAKEEQEIALSASIFSYPFKEEEISQILKSQLNPKYILEHLKKKNIILEKSGYYDVHDSIRSLLIDIVSKDRKKELHQIMENFYKDYMEKRYEEFNDVLYDDIFRWGYHLEFLEDSEVISPKCSELLRLEEDQLDALWAIERFGYPFAYDDPELEYSSSIIEELKKKDLIISNNDDEIKNMLTVKEFVLNNFDLFDSSFLHHLCITRDISNHLGYIERFEPNDAFIRQGIICHWEHCIEYMPLENNRNENSCPVFGHNCPSGKEQVIICKEFTN